MTDFDVVRDALPEVHSQNPFRADSAVKEIEEALNRIEPDVAGLKVELEDALSALGSLQQENERLRRERDVARDLFRDASKFEVKLVDRLRRIEEAARKVDREAGLQGSAKGMTAALRELHSALNQEVKG